MQKTEKARGIYIRQLPASIVEYLEGKAPGQLDVGIKKDSGQTNPISTPSRQDRGGNNHPKSRSICNEVRMIVISW